MFQLPDFCSKLLYTLAPPYLFRTVFQSGLRGCLLGLSAQKVCQIEYNSQLSGCALFSVDTCKSQQVLFFPFPFWWVSSAILSLCLAKTSEHHFIFLTFFFLFSVDANYVHLLSLQPVCNIFMLSRAPASPRGKLLHTSNDEVFVATTQGTPPAHLVCRQQGLHSQDVIYSCIL